MEEGASFLSKFPRWSVKFVPRVSNAAAHILARWAAHANFFGYLSPSGLPNAVLQGLETDSVTALAGSLNINDDG